MTDAYSRLDSGSPGPLYLRDRDLEESLDLLSEIARRLSGTARSVLEAKGYGMAHFRVLLALQNHAGSPVAELLDRLDIRKQSLHRVLKPLLDDGLVESRVGEKDRRQRLLALSPQGAKLVDELTGDARAELADAFRRAGPAAVAGFRSVLLNLTKDAPR